MSQTPIPLAGLKAVIFDMDGTMVNNMAYHQKAWQEFLKRRHLTLTEEEFKQKVSGRKNDQIFELVFGKKLDKQSELTYGEEKEALYRELFKADVKEILGLTQLIEELQSRNFKTAIATTSPAKNREFILKALRLEGKFEVILGGEHVHQGKPHPEIYLSVANMLGMAPKECLVFEDSPHGVTSAKNAGMTVVGILSSHSPQELQDADYLADNFTDLVFIG